MTTLNPWINFNGNAEEAFTFYQSVFGGEFSKVIRFKDLTGPGIPVGEDGEKIMQITLPIDGGHILIGNDLPTFMGKVNEQENRSKIHVGADSKEEAERLFNGLSHGGQIEAAPGDSAWGTYFGMLRDTNGIEWITECNPNT